MADKAKKPNRKLSQKGRSEETGQADTFQAMQALLAFERQYTQMDARMKHLAVRLEAMAHQVREWLAENELGKSKRALYPFLLPGMDIDAELKKFLIDQSFEQWYQDFNATAQETV